MLQKNDFGPGTTDSWLNSTLNIVDNKTSVKDSDTRITRGKLNKTMKIKEAATRGTAWIGRFVSLYFTMSVIRPPLNVNYGLQIMGPPGLPPHTARTARNLPCSSGSQLP